MPGFEGDAKASKDPKVLHITGENPTNASAAGQSKDSCASTSSPPARKEFARHIVFFAARSSACFKILLFRIKREMT